MRAARRGFCDICGGVIKLIQFIDLNALRKNLQYLSCRAEAMLLFMVKADAYGHGMQRCAKAAEGIVDYLGVATVEEGVRLKKSGIEKPILVTVFCEEDAHSAVKNDLICGAATPEQITALARAAVRQGKTAAVHIKLDTGMNRLGIKGEAPLKSLLDCADASRVEVLGCYSHLYNVNEEQFQRFAAISKIVKERYPDAVTHLSSSAALLKNGRDGLDMVRVGIAAYGYGDKNLSPVMSVRSKVVAARAVDAGEHIGYGDFCAPRKTNIAVVFSGYADGVLRKTCSYALIRERLCPILTFPCMDMTFVETGDFLARTGETVWLLSNQLDAEKIARDRGTVPYEVLTSFARERCKRVYIGR
jgi:alanine racemase